MEEFLILIYDEDLYVNNGSLVYDNSCFRVDSLVDKEDFDDYFDVSYDGFLIMFLSKNNIFGYIKLVFFEIDFDLLDYINVDCLDLYC